LEYADATNQLGALLAENERLKSNPRVSELLRLRGELSRLKAAEARDENDPIASVANPWVERVGQLKQYLARHPDKCIPEFQYLTGREWLVVVGPGSRDVDFGAALDSLKWQAISRFANVVTPVLQKYAQGNDGRFPTDLAQLQPYCDPGVEAILQQRYEIKPGSVLPPSAVRDLGVKTDWVVAGKDTVGAGTADRVAIYTNGNTLFW
jgi:hypothetical protein